MAVISVTPATPNLGWEPWAKAQPGDVVELGAGVYEQILVANRPKAGPGVIVQPAAGAQVVVGKGIVVDGSAGWHFRSNPAGGPRMRSRGGQVGGKSDDCSFRAIDFYGDEGAGQDPARLAVAGGIFGVDAARCVMDGCTHKGVQGGVSYKPTAAGLQIRNAVFDGLGGDGIAGIANDVLIEDVLLTNFFVGATLHQDAIQVYHRWVNGGVLPTGIVMRRIRLLKGAGDSVQFLVQCAKGAVFQDIWNQMGNYHGLTIDDSEDVTVERVRADGMVGCMDMGDPARPKQMASWIKVEGLNPTVRDCLASAGVYGSTGEGAWERNGTIPLAPAGDYSAGQVWWDRVVLDAEPPPVEPAPEPPPVVTPPAPAVDAAEIRRRLDKARVEVNATRNAAARALYAIDQALEALP